MVIKCGVGAGGGISWFCCCFIIQVYLPNNYIVRSYRDVIVVANIVTRRTSKA